MTVLSTVDHDSLALERIALQYQESPRFIAYIKALMAQPNEIEGVFWDVEEISDIALAEGVNLDVIGAIVGMPRIVKDVLFVSFFGFDDQLATLPYGDEGLINIGGRFRDEEEPHTGSSVLSDIEYRMLIRAKIVKNHSKGTVDDVTSALSFIFGGAPTVVDDIGGMSFGIAIGRGVTLTEIALLDQDILPRPAGVRIAWRGYYNAADGYLGFDGQPGAVGFQEEGATGPAGFLMEEF